MDAPFPRAFSADYLGDEARLIHAAADRALLTAAQATRVRELAESLVAGVRAARRSQTGLDAFLQQYSLSSKEGVILLCLAESLLRIPDTGTADRLIAEKIRAGDWGAHAGESASLFVNASTWSLMLTGRLLRPEEEPAETGHFVQRLVARAGEPVVRAALLQAMRILGTQFVMARSIGEALRRAREDTGHPWRYSFDMLGEAALTWADADRHYDEYLRAIDAIAVSNISADEAGHAGVSLKLSALHPRFEPGRMERAVAQVMPRVLELAQRAANLDVPLTIDAEEAERLEMMLAVVRGVMESTYLEGWRGFGFVVQAYQRRAPAVLEWSIDLAARHKRRLNIRLVKGAYWDSEIKRAQDRGLTSYPVYTRKINSDVAWLACARRLIAADAWLIQPQFATHNAHAVAWVMTVAGEARRDFEFQRLHGMGRELYAAVDAPCRVYAPVGSHTELLPYLVRRLLENGANTSFVHRLVDERLPVEEVVRDPVPQVQALAVVANPAIPPPLELYGARRRNSAGFNFGDSAAVAILRAEGSALATRRYRAGPLIAGMHGQGAARPVLNPARNDDVVGSVNDTRPEEALAALGLAAAAFPAWEATPAVERAQLLRRAADAFEAQRVELMSLCVREAGKTWPNALAEVREAVDYLRYYAARAEADFGAPLSLPGPTGERNELVLHGRGPFLCISPWNFPLAIFTGQVAAALAAGNTVLAKPAEQTPLVAARAVALLHEAGIPSSVLAYLPGDGPTLGRALLADPRVAGVAFTGSTEVAQVINRQLGARDGPIATLVAETGGQNVMIVDSSALPEQVVLDVAASAFDSAGQRCSAARVLLLQEDIAERTISLLRGYMETLLVGDPALLETDVGPVIDAEARASLEVHVGRLAPAARWLQRSELPEPAARRGHYFAPVALEIESLALLRREVFGPVLHVVRYRAADLDATIDAINAMGYGLTLGVQTRVEATARRIAARARVGNVYVNRTMIGAVVGVQPFGGAGLSGTGPKAGGPHYLHRFATERTISTNTAAVGGNAGLLSLDTNPDE